MHKETKVIASINDVPILIIDNGQKLVPIKPICAALGIDEEPQRKKIQNDEFLNSVASLKEATGADGKEYKMTCLPYKYIFGWLFTINPNNVRPEAYEAVLRYRMECYNILYQHFSDTSEFLEQKQKALVAQMDEVNQKYLSFKKAKDELAEAETRLDNIRDSTFEQWNANDRNFDFEIVKRKGQKKYQ